MRSTNNREVKIIVEEFERHWGRKVTVPIIFSPVRLSETTTGVCFGFQSPKFTRIIVLDEQYWETISYWYKEAIIFHELGHCELDLEHDEEKVSTWYDDRPRSIMHPFNHSYYRYFRDEYIEQMFTSWSSKQSYYKLFYLNPPLRNRGQGL